MPYPSKPRFDTWEKVKNYVSQIEKEAIEKENLPVTDLTNGQPPAFKLLESTCLRLSNSREMIPARIFLLATQEQVEEQSEHLQYQSSISDYMSELVCINIKTGEKVIC